MLSVQGIPLSLYLPWLQHYPWIHMEMVARIHNLCIVPIDLGTCVNRMNTQGWRSIAQRTGFQKNALMRSLCRLQNDIMKPTARPFKYCCSEPACDIEEAHEEGVVKGRQKRRKFWCKTRTMVTLNPDIYIYAWHMVILGDFFIVAHKCCTVLSK